MDSYINTVLWALLRFEAKLWPNKKNIRSEFQLQFDSLVIVSCILNFFAVVYIEKIGLIRNHSNNNGSNF